jgi:PAS domain-containing protein
MARRNLPPWVARSVKARHASLRSSVRDSDDETGRVRSRPVIVHRERPIAGGHIASPVPLLDGPVEREALAHAEAAVTIFDAERRFHAVNDRYVELTGYGSARRRRGLSGPD